MKAFGKVMWGIGAAASVYFCVDILLGSRRPDAHGAAVAAQPARSQVGPVQMATVVPRTVQPLLAERPRQPRSPDPAPVETRKTEENHALTVALEEEYAADGRPTRESSEKERSLGGLFSNSNIEGKARLEDVTCREKTCRGTVRLASEGVDSEVFSRTFLSTEFALAIRDAISVTSREKRPDGSVIATFFVHPQSIFAKVSPSAE